MCRDYFRRSHAFIGVLPSLTPCSYSSRAALDDGRRLAWTHALGGSLGTASSQSFLQNLLYG